jgi:TP901-1 family phage major tail protein
MSAGAAAGAQLALRIETATANTFLDLGGLKTKSFTINNEVIETTNSDSTGRWREYLSGGLAMKSISFSGDGVFKDGPPTDRLMVVVSSASAENKFQLFLPGLGTFEGLFKVTSVEFSGDHADAVQYSMAAESNGVITFTNIP